MQRYLNLGSQESIHNCEANSNHFSEPQFDPTSDGQKGQKVVALEVQGAGCGAASLQGICPSGRSRAPGAPLIARKASEVVAGFSPHVPQQVYSIRVVMTP